MDSGFREGHVARDHRDMGQEPHDSIDGEAFGRQSVTFSDRLVDFRFSTAANPITTGHVSGNITPSSREWPS
jgi:hypothetical protein